MKSRDHSFILQKRASQLRLSRRFHPSNMVGRQQ